MRGGKRESTGGAMPGAGRKPDQEQKKAVALRLTKAQHKAFKVLGGSPWLQGLLNLEIRRCASNGALAQPATQEQIEINQACQVRALTTPRP